MNSNLGIDSVNVRIEDFDNGEVYVCSLFSDAGENGFILTESPPNDLPNEINEKINQIWNLTFNDTNKNDENSPKIISTGIWTQGNSSGEMELEFSINKGILIGKGTDLIGDFELSGFQYAQYLTFNKTYINKHSVLYFGLQKPNSEVFEGEWFITRSGAKGTFQLNIPNH
jgi:hypothetical protein